MIASPTPIDVHVGVLRDPEKLAAYCEINHFIPSGQAIPELFAQLRPSFLSMIKYAAEKNAGCTAKRQHPSLIIMVDDPDPSIELRVPCPVSFLQDVDKGFATLEAITTRLVSGQGVPTHWGNVNPSKG